MEDSFEHKVREKLTKPEIPFDPAAWKKMEQKLNALNPPAEKKRRRWVVWWLFPLLIGSTGILWYYLQPTSTLQNHVPAKTFINKQKETQNYFSQTHTPGASANKLSTQQLFSANKPSQEKMANSTYLGHKPKKVATIAENNRMNNNQNIFPDKTGGRIQETNAVTPFISDPVETLPTGTLFPKTATADSLATVKALANIDSSKSSNPNSSNAGKSFRSGKTVTKGWAVSLQVGPDFNIAPSMQYGRIGLSAGLLLHYHFNEKWFVSTGAAYSKKLYGATRNDYRLWAGNYNLTKVVADCRVLDLPLLINYVFENNTKEQISAFVGASSYLMLKEKYDYYFYTDAPKQKVMYNQNQHYFSVLDIGFTYTKARGKQLTWGFQPYVKIPLGGIGYGKVKLYSAGISFLVNYRNSSTAR